MNGTEDEEETAPLNVHDLCLLAARSLPNRDDVKAVLRAIGQSVKGLRPELENRMAAGLAAFYLHCDHTKEVIRNLVHLLPEELQETTEEALFG